MIKFQDQVPSIYPSASRDFQYLSWLINIVLNSVKHNVDSIYKLPNTDVDQRLTELLAMTLGFKVKRNYDQKQLAALVAAIPRILKYKGTAYAIIMAGEALIAASGATGNISISISPQGGELEIRLPKILVDVSLFTDLLPYILPAGMSCCIVRTDVKTNNPTVEFGYSDIVLADCKPDFEWDATESDFTGLSTMYRAATQTPCFANYKNEAKDLLNAGLLDNAIISDVLKPVEVISPVTSYTVRRNNSEAAVTLNHTSAEDNK